MASETNPLRDGAAGQNELDSSDFNAIIREQMGDVMGAEEARRPEADQVEPRAETQREEKREPEVITPSEKPEPGTPAQPDEVTRALSTISRLESEIADLRSRSMPQQARYEVQRREPDVEVEEIIPGVRLPKDQRQWPVQVTPELVKAVGIDPEIAPGLNKLANLFMLQINDLLRPLILNEVETRNKSRDNANATVAAFYGKYPDLRGQEDILDIVETKARMEDRIAERFAGEDYMAEVAKRARSRIAALRGQSLADYETQVKTHFASQASPTPQVSRAVTTPQRRNQTRPAATADQRELDDMLTDGRRF